MIRRAGMLAFLALWPATLAAQAPPAQVTAAGREPTLTLGGLIQAQVEFGDQGDSRFPSGNDRIYLRRARLNASGTFLEEFDFRVEVDMAGTLANTTGLRAQLTDGFVTWNRYPAANVRIGQFKTPFGYEQLVSDPRLFSLERSLVTDRLTLSRQLGVQVAGSALDRRLTYALGTFNGTGVNNNFNDDGRFLLAGRVTGIPWRGKLAGQEATWSVGAGGYRSEDTSVNLPDLGFDSTPATPDRDSQFGGKRNAWGADAQLVVGPFELWAEVLRARFEPTNRRPSPSLRRRRRLRAGDLLRHPQAAAAAAQDRELRSVAVRRRRRHAHAHRGRQLVPQGARPQADGRLPARRRAAPRRRRTRCWRGSRCSSRRWPRENDNAPHTPPRTLPSRRSPCSPAPSPLRRGPPR